MVRSGPDPEKLARTRAAAHTVVERGIFAVYLEQRVGLSIWGLEGEVTVREPAIVSHCDARSKGRHTVRAGSNECT